VLALFENKKAHRNSFIEVMEHYLLPLGLPNENTSYFPFNYLPIAISPAGKTRSSLFPFTSSD